jgi:hypothetical protein
MCGPGGRQHTHSAKAAAPAKKKEHHKAAAAAAAAEWTIGEEGLGTYDTCDTCDQCILDAVPEGVPPPAPAPNAEGVVHCTKCLGCTVVLNRMKESVPMLGKQVKVFAGASVGRCRLTLSSLC